MLLSVAMILLGFSARAGSITEEQAKAKALSFIQARHPSGGKRLAPASTPKELLSTPTGQAALYVFNIGERDGFVIVSGDDRARPILGYADSGTFEADNIPTALREMMAIYARQIDMLGQTEAVEAARTTERRISGTVTDVTPLLTTAWDQGTPYNAYCPTLNDQTALTGCVATAIAQIANYYKFPTKQVPSLAAYTSSTNKINVSAWGATTFDWDNMLNSYAGSYTNDQKVAVATLMRYCGQAAQMDYGFTSGAYNGDALLAFKDKLNYSADANFKSAASYTTDGWENLIYKEVREGRPVYYSALNGNEGGAQCGGHAFVIDGYRANGNYFHVNWGWGGACNGYFNIFALDPNAPESAATATGWHYQMLAIIGLKPNFTLTLGTPANGSISVDNNGCTPGTLKKITVTPADGYMVNAVTVTDATGQALPVTRVSNAINEYVFAFPKSSVTVNAEFTAGEAETGRVITGGLTLPSSRDSGNLPWTADTWTIWSNEYQPILGTPPTDALGHKWYEVGYVLTNNAADVQPNGNMIKWENHTAPFGRYYTYDYARACGATSDGPNNFYMRRVFTVNTKSIPTKLYLTCYYDDAPVEIYINDTLVYENQSQYAGSYTGELTPEQIALIHTDGTPNVLAARVSQGGGDYYLDCGLYDPTAISYEITGEQTVRVIRNPFLTGDIVIPETVTYNGVTYTVTELPENATNDLPYLTSISIPKTITSMGNNVFVNLPNLKYVKSYIPIYQVNDQKTLVAAPIEATEFEVDEDCSRIWDNAFKFTNGLTKLTLPRSLTYIGKYAFTGCSSLKDIYAYILPTPQTESNAFEGIDKSKTTVYIYASTLNSFKQSWGEGFKYVTKTDPQPITLTINVTSAGTLRALIEEAVAQRSGTLYDVVGITVTGTINNDDVRTLSAMCTGVYSLATIDLSSVSILGNSIEGRMFYDKDKLTSIILPETLENIGDAAFENCDGLTAINIPASVKRINSYAFSGCGNLVTVTGCKGLTDANAWEDWYIFGWTPNIKGDVYGGTTFLSLDKDATGEYEVPDGIKVIAGGSMHGRNITSVVIPASVTDLGNDVFRACHSLKDFYIYAATPPVCHEGSMEYDYDKSQATLHVPAMVIEDYKKATEWCEMGSIVAMASYDLTVNVTAPGSFATVFKTAMTNANIPTMLAISKLTVNGNLNDDDLKELADIGTKNTLIDIRSHYTIVSDKTLIALDTCATSFTFDNSLRAIHNFAFSGCSDLKNIHFTNNITIPSLPAKAFAGEDKSKVTLQVYVSYLERFQKKWGEDFRYLVMDDPEDIVLIFTGEPLYLYNADAGLYFTAGNGYGTEASLGAEPMEVSLEAGPDDSYIIKTCDGSDELFIEGDRCFVDRSGRERDYYWEFLSNDDGTLLIRMSSSNIYGNTPQSHPSMYFGRSNSSETRLSHLTNINNTNAQVRWQLKYLADGNTIELTDGDYTTLCALSNTLGGSSWTKKWDTTTRKATRTAWPGVAVNDEGHVTAIGLAGNNLSGDISSLTLSGLTALKSINLSNNAITGNIQTLAASLPNGCVLNVEGQNLGFQGEHTLYELCNYSGLPSIAYYQSGSGTMASTLIGVGGYCQFYHEGTGGRQYWDCYIYANGGTYNNNRFYWPSPVTVECLYPHHFTFTYKYSMGDANMDDALNVLDLQTTLNYSNNQGGGLFNFYAADTYGSDNDINVQDIVKTVNILLAQENNYSAPARALDATSTTESEACISVENGEIVLHTTKPVAALDLHLASIKPEQLNWNTEIMGFATATAAQADGTHAIIYSMLPRQMEEGRTVLATFDANLSPHLTAAVLSDSQARPVSVGYAVSTGIHLQPSTTLHLQPSVYDLQGRRLSGQQAKGVYIINGKKVVVK